VLSAMTFAKPEYSLDIVDLAGDALIDLAAAPSYFEDAGVDYIEVINNWRRAHLYPLTTFQMTLRNRSKAIDPDFIVAQRIKRPQAIEAKLRRKPELKLSIIQDIGGCRAILSSVQQVYELVERYERQYSGHKLIDHDDYIKRPKPDGYRSYHLIYCYSNPKHEVYENLKIEIQIRSTLQHYWATAVETVDIFRGEGLKAHRGSPDWRRFFILMGSVLAIREGTRRVPHTPRDSSELIDELRHYVEKLNVFAVLESFRQTLEVIPSARKSRIKWVVLELDPRIGALNAPSLRLYGYRGDQIQSATDMLEAVERHRQKGVDAVLVSVADAVDVRKAYPNYYLDTSQFLDAVREAIS
jgi:ppGpp synthetase/RelA/SpoT-type nucleotidyltranferase